MQHCNIQFSNDNEIYPNESTVNNNVQANIQANKNNETCPSIQVSSTFFRKESDLPICTNQTFLHSVVPIIHKLPKIINLQNVNNYNKNRYFYKKKETYDKYKDISKNATDEHWVNIEDWKQINIDRDRDTIAYDDSTNIFLFGVVSSKHSRSLFSPTIMKQNMINIHDLFSSKNNVSRGYKKKGISLKYVLFGYRYPRYAKPDNAVSRYAYKPYVSKEFRNKYDAMSDQLVRLIETCTSRILIKSGDYIPMKNMHSQSKYPTMSACKSSNQKFATQFAISKNYCSQAHIDRDYYHSSLSCYSEKDKRSYIYMFVFEEYKCFVYLRSCDVICFNPTILHAATCLGNTDDCYIFSCYTSKKTVDSFMKYGDNNTKYCK